MCATHMGAHSFPLPRDFQEQSLGTPRWTALCPSAVIIACPAAFLPKTFPVLVSRGSLVWGTKDGRKDERKTRGGAVLSFHPGKHHIRTQRPTETCSGQVGKA